ncbi:MAG: C1 family peptidase, partial [Anaerolineales bacterium]
MKKGKVMLGLSIIIVFLFGCQEVQIEAEINKARVDITGMGNPSAVYCQELGFEFKIVQESSGERGICILPEAQECDAWDFLEGICGQSQNYCAQQDLDTVVKHDGKNGFSQSYAVCVDENQAEVGTAADLIELGQKSLGCGVGLEEAHPPEQDSAVPAQPLDSIPPASFDWRNYDEGGNWTTSVKNQGSCGSCWAFSAVGVAESAINIAMDDPAYDLNLSEQYLVADCYQEFDGYGTCCGGRKSYALNYIWYSGIPDENCLPYVDGTGCTCNPDYLGGPLTCDVNCTFNASDECSDRECSNRCPDWSTRRVYIQDYGYVGTDKTTIKQYLVDKGPLAVSLDMYGDFDGGIFRCPIEDGYTNHAVAIVGYNTTGPGEYDGYWIVRNSWGSGWDGDGHFEVGFGECSIEEYVYYALPERVDWYVSPTGSDANDCRGVGTACETIQGAIDKAGPGGIVHVAAGTYNENLTMKSGVDVIGNSPTDTKIEGTASVNGVVKFYFVTDATLQNFWITVDTPVPGTDRAVVFEGSTDQTAGIKNSIINNTQYGIFVKSPSSPTIENNTFVADSDEQGIYIYTGAQPTIRNNIITGYATTGIRVLGGTTPPLPIITYNDIWNNGSNYVNYPDQTGINGNISSDPDFVNLPGLDFHLFGSSPAIDAGDPTSEYDNEPEPNGDRVNIGAYGNTIEAAIISYDRAGFYAPDTKIWRMRTGNTWSDSVNYLVWGPNGGGWTPVTGDWDDDGIDEVGFYDPVTKIWRMRTGNTWSDSVNYLVWGPNGGGWTPVTG